ncbi:RNA 3'-terminal phosphate cyclase [Meredithblackwellia eburnea MCA 4105]
MSPRLTSTNNLNKTSTIEIDGSQGEGGGQIIRLSCALATLLRQPIKVTRVRAGRANPGLQAQHTCGVKLVGEICSAEMDGVAKGLSEFEFKPGAIELGKEYVSDLRSAGGLAGAVTLLVQIALPTLLFSDNSLSESRSTTLKLLGGTCTTSSPQIGYTAAVLLPFLGKHFGLAGIDIHLHQRGYYPLGGGEVELSINSRSTPLPAINCTDRGRLLSIRGVAHAGGTGCEAIAQSIKDAALSLFMANKSFADTKIEISTEICTTTQSRGCGLVLWAATENSFIGGSALGTLRKRNSTADPDAVALEAVTELSSTLDNEKIVVDEYMQDQLVVFMALAAGVSEVVIGTPSLHTTTAIAVVEQMTEARFQLISRGDGTTLMKCHGIGYTFVGG